VAIDLAQKKQSKGKLNNTREKKKGTCRAHSEKGMSKQPHQTNVGVPDGKRDPAGGNTAWTQEKKRKKAGGGRNYPVAEEGLAEADLSTAER